jgi:predicted HicB family RNase H-like nuclease
MKDVMQYKDYYGSVHFNDDELIFHGKIEFIRALVSYEATTAKGLRKAF